MAVCHKLPPHESSNESSGTENSRSAASTSDDETGSTCSSSIYDESSDNAAHGDVEAAESGAVEDAATAAAGASAMVVTTQSVRRRPIRSSLRLVKACCKGASVDRSTRNDSSASMARLRYQLASLRSVLPPGSRSPQLQNVIADALRYKKALAKELELLYKAIPVAQQVKVKRSRRGYLQIGVSCAKEPGLLVALMEALDSFGVMFVNMNVSCVNDKIRIDAVSTKDIGESIGPLKVTLMSTIMRFSSKRQ